MSHVSAAICVCAPFRRDLIGFHAADLTPEEAAKVTAARPPVVSPQGLLLFVGIFHGMAFGLLEMRATMTLKFNRLDPGFMWSDRVSHQNTLAISLLRASKSSRSTAFCDLHPRMSSCIATFLCFAVSVVLSCATVLVLRWSEATGLVGKLSTECRRDSRLSRFLVAVYTILEVFVSGTFISALWMTLQFHVVTFLVVMWALKLAVLHLGESGIMETTD
jgi:hypothetical protein